MVIDVEQAKRPVAPGSVDGTGLEFGVVADLTLKTLYFAGNISGNEVADRLALSVTVATEVLDFLRREHLCEVTGGTGRSRGTLRYSLSGSGIDRASQALERSGYVGPAPVPLSAYKEQVRKQSILNAEISHQGIEESLSHLILPERTKDLIGQAVSAKRASLLYGASGNGKTSAAQGLRAALPGDILIPYAIEVMREIIQVYDPSTHEAVETAAADGEELSRPGMPDRRWVLIRRPAVIAGGELSAHHLDLMLDEVHKTYEAPIQMKANGGLLIIDDFGRQRLEAVYLLNRWVIPLEQHVDYLSLHSGARFEVPFDAISLFVTNLLPEALADDAFLRRIRYKVEIPGPDASSFLEILKGECQRYDVAYDDKAASYFTKIYTKNGTREMRGCHPRDIVEAIVDAARYHGKGRALTPAAIDEACANYFV